MGERLWVVGKATSDDGLQWEFQGVFSSEAKAVAACRDERYMVGPVELDAELPAELTYWPGGYYPKAV